MAAPLRPSMDLHGTLPLAGYEKALQWSAFLLWGLLLGPSAFAASCHPPSPGERVRVEHLFDGDTLRLADDRRVRLIAVNAPELGRDGAPDQPLARVARQAAQRFITAAASLTLHSGREAQDHYGRTRAHLYNSAGESLEAELLRQGLGFYISMPPNLAQRDCLRAAEAEARRLGRGVWALPAYRPLPAARLGSDDGGFQRVRGRVTATGQTRSGPYLELGNRLFVRVRQRHLEHFSATDFDALQGETVEVRGWVIPRRLTANQKRKGFMPFMLELRHPDNLTRSTRP